MVILIDLLRGYRQHMWIMNIVWPVTALYAGPLALWSYFTLGRTTTHQNIQRDMAEGRGHPGSRRSRWQAIALATTHCGAGCTLGDILAEWLLVAAPVVALWFGYQSIFRHKIFAAWAVDYLFALVVGIGFQYFTIAPMRNLSLGQGIAAAVKADALSLTSWQVGMYGFMALAYFLLFGCLLHIKLEPTSVEFWFMMQLAMLSGFATAFPVNAWLIRTGIKEKM